MSDKARSSRSRSSFSTFFMRILVYSCSAMLTLPSSPMISTSSSPASIDLVSAPIVLSCFQISFRPGRLQTQLTSAPVWRI